MVSRLDRTEQRIVGVLIEKERTVPDAYPLSENALVDGCNQKSNREPPMDLAAFQVAGALMSLQQKDWVARIDGSGRVTKFRHKVVERLGLRPPELAVLAELLLRGPQAPGALKPRVARFGVAASPAEIEAVLASMASRPEPLVEQLPLGPRERDRRWRHLLGDGSEAAVPAAAAGEARGGEAPPAPDGARSLEARVAALEAAVAALERQMAVLRREVGSEEEVAEP